MKKIFMLLLGFIFMSLGACAEKASYPQECVDALNNWDTLLSRMQNSGKFSPEVMGYFKENRDFIISNIQNTNDFDLQRQACTPINQVMQENLRQIENIQNMSPNEIDSVFGVDRIH